MILPIQTDEDNNQPQMSGRLTNLARAAEYEKIPDKKELEGFVFPIIYPSSSI